MVFVSDVDCISEAAAVYDDGLSVVEDGGDGFDIVELWGPVAGWSWAQVHAWSSSILRRSGEVGDVLDWAAEALDAGCEFAGVLAERLHATEKRKRLAASASAAEADGDHPRAAKLRAAAEAVEVPAVPVDDTGGGDFEAGGAGRWALLRADAKSRGDKQAAAYAAGWVRWYKRRDAGIKPGRAREALDRVPLVTLPAVAVTLADCVDAAHGRLPEGVDWQEVNLWPSDWEADAGRETDWTEVREAAIERDAPSADWVNANPAEVAAEAARRVFEWFRVDDDFRATASRVWGWWKLFKTLSASGQRAEVYYFGRLAMAGHFKQRGRYGARVWVETPVTTAVLDAAARLLGRELYGLVGDDDAPGVRFVSLPAIQAARARREALDAEAAEAKRLALARWRAKRSAGEV